MTQSRCPRCGLVQLQRSNCKSCGASLTAGGVGIAPAAAVATNRPHSAVIVAFVTVALVAIAGWGALWWSKKDLRDSAEVIQALHDIQSVANVGVNRGEFAMRLHEASIKVDRYLRDHKTTNRNRDLRMRILKTLVVYEYADKVWNSDSSADFTDRDWGAIWRDCGAEYESMLGISMEKFSDLPYSPKRDVPILFSCASRILDEK